MTLRGKHAGTGSGAAGAKLGAMALVEITEQQHDVVIALAYATAHNITGVPIYRHPHLLSQ